MDGTEVNGIGGLIKPKGISIVVLDLKYGTGKIQSLNFEQVCYFPGAPKFLFRPQKWARYRQEDEV